MTDNGSGNTSSSARQQQFDEILADLMRAIDGGESVDSDEWITRHPDFATELREFFVKNERLEKLVRPLRQPLVRPQRITSCSQVDFFNRPDRFSGIGIDPVWLVLGTITV